jgi:hypothetical protein
LTSSREAEERWSYSSVDSWQEFYTGDLNIGPECRKLNERTPEGNARNDGNTDRFSSLLDGSHPTKI